MSDILAITYEDAIAVTQSDGTNDPAGPFAGFYVGVSGDVSVLTKQGQTVVFKNCQQGTIYTVAIRRVGVTNTTATNILGMRASPFATAGQ